MRKEAESLKQLRHENIISYYGSFEVKSEQLFSSKVYLVMEYMTGGSLHNIINMYKPLTESAIRNYTRQMLNGLVYLHNQKFIHRDIKAANILLHQDKLGSLKLADFGTMAELIDDPCYSWQGSILWFSPEVHRSREYSEASDIWAIGCTVCEMVTGMLPLVYNDANVTKYSSMELYNRLMTSLSPIPNPLQFPMSLELQDFLKHCFALDPKNRATAQELLKHSFLIEKDFDSPLATQHIQANSINNSNLSIAVKQAPVSHQQVFVNNQQQQQQKPQGNFCDSISTEYHSDSDEDEQSAGDSMKS